MKHILTLAAALFIAASSVIYAQTQRMVLLEHFTQASCGPCATYNPGVQAILAANPDKVAYVKYQTSWPGYDPMNLHNPQDVAARVSFYGGSFGVPYSVIDGNVFAGHPNGWNTTTINNRYAISSPFDLQVQHWLSPAQDSIHVLLIAKATAPVSGNLTIMVAVIEKLIQFAVAPGTNQEKNFYHVMKKLLPGPIGTALPSSMTAGDYVIYQGSWKLANVYNINQLGVVAWVQDRSSREIHQAANSDTLDIVPPYTTDLAMRRSGGVGTSWCQDVLKPWVTIRNQGSLPVTTAEIRYSLNGGPVQSHTWTGNLGFLEQANIELPQSSITLDVQNHLKLYLHSVNGQPDLYARNDTLVRSFYAASQVGAQVTFILMTDNKPQETTWDIKDDQGNIVYSGGPYAQSGALIQQTFTFTEEGCYTFTLRDAGGDGICCGNGYGVYQLLNNNAGVIGEGDNFGAEAIHAWTIGGSSGIDTWQALQNLEVYPNPVSDVMHLAYYLTRPQDVKVGIMDMSGRTVKEYAYPSTQAGSQQLSLPVHEFAPGLYLLQVRAGDYLQTRKLHITD